ncbi:MAG: hypothetical protein IPN62_17560 [Flavobacteriales bacterium]|nr:hypothetical protein [Flavobacteriales bacterium]
MSLVFRIGVPFDIMNNVLRQRCSDVGPLGLHFEFFQIGLEFPSATTASLALSTSLGALSEVSALRRNSLANPLLMFNWRARSR